MGRQAVVLQTALNPVAALELLPDEAHPHAIRRASHLSYSTQSVTTFTSLSAISSGACSPVSRPASACLS